MYIRGTCERFAFMTDSQFAKCQMKKKHTERIQPKKDS